MLHIYLFLSRTFRVIEFVAVLVITFHTSTSTCFFASKTFFLESFLVNILNSLYINQPILLLKVTFRNPDGTYIVHPYEMADWLIIWISCLWEVVIVRFLLPFAWFWMNILLFVFIVRALLSEFVIFWVCVFEEWGVDMDWCSFYSATLDIA